MTVGEVKDLENKVAIVTGAQRGIGLATAKRLAAGGATVVIADLPGTDLATPLAQLAEYGAAVSQHTDIRDESSVRSLLAFVMDTFGRLDILDNNAAFQGSLEDGVVDVMDAELWDQVFAVNARGAMLMCKHSIQAMVQGQGGSIINISSGTAAAGNLYQTAYACSKGAVNTLTRYVATQYARQGIRCNAIASGLVKTEKLAATMPVPLQDLYAETKLAGRLGQPQDIAEMVAFLASDKSSWITGQVFPVDGGFFAKAPQLENERRLMASMQLVVGDTS